MTGLLIALALSGEPPTPVAEPPKPAQKKSSLFKKKSDASDSKSKGDVKPPVLPDRPIPKPEDAPKKGSALDEELAKDLAKSIGVDDEEDPLLRAGQRMRTVEEQFAKADVGGQTVELQDKIVADLTELLKRAKQNQQKQNQQKNQKQQQNQQQQQQQQQQAQQQQNQQQRQNQNDKANDASARAQAGRATKEELAKMREQRDVWGHLPELERQLMQQSFKDEMLPEYRQALEKYYRKLAEQAAGKDK